MFGWELLNFNFHDGYPEATLRALQKGFLREEHYN
jgi:hypothetical protein